MDSTGLRLVVLADSRSREQSSGWDYEGWVSARTDEKSVGT